MEWVGPSSSSKIGVVHAVRTLYGSINQLQIVRIKIVLLHRQPLSNLNTKKFPPRNLHVVVKRLFVNSVYVRNTFSLAGVPRKLTVEAGVGHQP